jgi:RNA polymerase sigma factor (sigma-70 family)
MTMSTASLDTMLEKLSAGDSEAAERIFHDYEPILRAIVRRRLTPPMRAKFDSMDVVQSVWADVLSGFRQKERDFADRAHLKAFLARVTYNHFVNHCRRHGRALECEQSYPDDESPELAATGQPRPSQVVQADELWNKMIELCPPARREVLELKRQGLSVAEIASRTGLHEGSVRRLLYELARRLAGENEASSGSST